MMTIELRYYTDPACVWSWGSEPKLRRLLWEFGDGFDVRLVMGGLARSYGPSYRDEEGRIGAGTDCFSDLMAHWLDVAARTGMPCDPRLWTESKINSTYPVCMAVIAAREQGSAAGQRYLRRAREALFTERRKLDHADALIAEAGSAGIDVNRFKIDLASNAIVEAFGNDLDEVRDVPDEARASGAVKVTEGRERLSFPSLVFIGGDGERHGVWGWRPYEEYRAAAIAAGAQASNGAGPEPLAVLERLGRCATREIEELTGRPRPVVEAELWRLATDWRVKPVPVLTGTLWEPV
jgi:predicted DsbA family dithiol-disulfide isomerase